MLSDKARRLGNAIVDDGRCITGGLPSQKDLAWIMERAERNATEGHAEPAWNSDVHTDLLKLALRNSPHFGKVDYMNMYCTPLPRVFAFRLTVYRSTAAIQPSKLVPDSTPVEKTPSKKADFAITLLLGHGRKNAISQACIRSLNQSFYNPLRYSPIAISIETKIPGEGWDNAMVQLSTWASAQLTQLRSLLTKGGISTTQCMALPLIITQGHEWYFLIMEDCEDCSVSRYFITPH